MVKLTKRKGFNFYRSYFDVVNELEKDKDKLSFLLALLDKQFLGIDPDLKGIVKFAYISQMNNIDTQVKGWESKTKLTLLDPCQGGAVGGSVAPSVQEKEKEKEKEEYTIPTFEEFKKHSDSKKLDVNQTKLKLKYDSWVENNWHDGNGKPVKNWKSKLTATLPFILNDKSTKDKSDYMTRVW